MDIEKLDTIVCAICKKKFVNEQKCYSIESKTFKTSTFTMESNLVYMPIKGTTEECGVLRCINFCEECFSELAGKEYMP